jgi:hypothetical protein
VTTTYVYGITRARPDGLGEDLTGVGDPPRPVRVLREGDLAAVVSDCPEGLRPKRRDLFAHQRVLTAAATAGPVLPLRFGSVCDDDSAVTRTLADHAGFFAEQLDAVTDRVEYNVKAAYHESAELRRILAERPEIRQLNAATRSGGTYEDRLRLGQLVADAMNEHRAHDAAAVEELLAPYADRVAHGQTGSDRVLNLSFLLGREPVVGFLTALESLREERPHLDVRVTGPLPPYSFVAPLPVAGAAQPVEAGR